MGAGRGDARRPRAAQGLPDRIEDPATAARLAAMLREQPMIKEHRYNKKRKNDHADTTSRSPGI
jgi:hypothetical protein